MTVRDRLRELAQSAADEDHYADVYGGGELLETVEREIAQLLGKESAVFMVSGTMAQQAALRVHCDRRATRFVACHPQSHLLVSENDAYRRLHGLEAVALGERQRLYSLDDLRRVQERVGAVLMELPERNLGGALRPFSEVEEIAAYARECGTAMHLDGARLWETQPFYGMALDEIARPFDTVYVSFYKALGAIAGAALAGPKDVIDEARAWQWRHGGRLVHHFPYVVSARDALQQRLPLMPRLCERARSIAAILAAFEDVEVTPNPPPTNMMHVYVRGDRAHFEQAAVRVSLESGVLMPLRFSATPVPGWAMFELSCGEGSLAITDDETRELFGKLLARP